LRSFPEHRQRLLHDSRGPIGVDPALDQVLHHLRFRRTGPQARKDIPVQPLLPVDRPAERAALSRVQ